MLGGWVVLGGAVLQEWGCPSPGWAPPGHQRAHERPVWASPSLGSVRGVGQPVSRRVLSVGLNRRNGGQKGSAKTESSSLCLWRNPSRRPSREQAAA